MRPDYLIVSNFDKLFINFQWLLMIPEYKTTLVDSGLSSANLMQNRLEDLIKPIQNFSSLSSYIDEICGRSYLSSSAIFSPNLDTQHIGADLDNSREIYKIVSSATSPKNIGESLEVPSKWTLGTDEIAKIPLTNRGDIMHGLNIDSLTALETRTSILARTIGINKITSVASQISSISSLVSPLSDSVKELIAPSSMLSDLGKIAFHSHQLIENTDNLSVWNLGLVDSASYLVDRQVNWTSKVCNSVYEDKLFTHIDGLSTLPPRVNFVSLIPLEFEREKKKKSDVTPTEFLKKSAILRLTEKGKRLIDKVVNINNLCLRTGMEPLFKYTGNTTRAAATIGGTICSSRDDLGCVIDCLYMFFYENLERIKKVVTDDVVRNDDNFQCIFRVKLIRTDYRHDYEHGSEGDIRKKNQSIGDSYFHYSGKPALISGDDYLMTQEKLYDEFDKLMDYIQNILVS